MINWDEIENGVRIILGLQLVLVGAIHIINKKSRNIPLGLLTIAASLYFFWKWLLPILSTTGGRIFLLLNRELFIPPLLYLVLLQTNKNITKNDYLRHLTIPIVYVIISQIIIIPNYDVINIQLVANSVGMFSCIIAIIFYFFLGRKKLIELKETLIAKAYLKYKSLFYILITCYAAMYLQGILSYFIQYRILLTNYGNMATGKVYTDTDNLLVNMLGWFFNVPFDWFNRFISYPIIYLTPLFLVIFSITELSFFKTLFLPQELKLNNKVLKTGDLILEKLENYFSIEKPFKNKNFTIENCCQVLNCNKKELQDSLSYHKNKSFKDYVDMARVNEFKELASKEENKIYDITSIAKMAGFNSKATFYRIFKEQEGVTPKEYMKSVK